MFNFHCSLDHYAKTGVRVFYLYWFVTIVLRKPISACTSMLNIVTSLRLLVIAFVYFLKYFGNFHVFCASRTI